MSNTEIQANIVRNTFGLMATPAPADIARAHADALSTLDFNNVVADSTRQHTGDIFPDLDRLTAELPAIIDQSMRDTIPGHYTPEAAKAVTDTMLDILTGELCPVWPTICTDTTPGHYDHFNHQHKVTDKRGETLLDISFTQFSDEDGDNPPKVSLGGMTSEDYDPAEVREATAKIRRLLDEADDMADKILRMQSKAVPTPSEPTVHPGFHLVPAAIGKASTRHPVWVECPTWCEDDHVANFQHNIEDLDHRGIPTANWETNCIIEPDERVLSLDARIHCQPSSGLPDMVAAHVLLDDETTEAFLTPDMADKTADELTAFASQLRRLARDARHFNATAKACDNQADEALRRVRPRATAGRSTSRSASSAA